jgi:hypothetical protein
MNSTSGIFRHSWQVKQQNLLARASSSSDHSDSGDISSAQRSLDRLFETRAREIRVALTIWLVAWRKAVGGCCEADAHLPALYKDRALVWLYLAGVFIEPDCRIVSAKQASRRQPGSLTVCSFIQRLIVLLDHGQLESLGMNFAAVLDIVRSAVREDEKPLTLGALMYIEPDAVKPGFT